MPKQFESVGITVEVPAKHDECFKVQPVRWRIGCLGAWLKNFRRLCSDFERLVEATDTFIWRASVILSL